VVRFNVAGLALRSLGAPQQALRAANYPAREHSPAFLNASAPTSANTLTWPTATPVGRARPVGPTRPSWVVATDRARPAAGPAFDPLLGAGGGELVAAGWAGGDPDAAEQVQVRLGSGAGVEAGAMQERANGRGMIGGGHAAGRVPPG
jgi:hypothetical protein